MVDATSRRQFLATAATGLSGLALADSAAASHTATIDVGLYSEVDFSGEEEAMAVEALEEFDEQLDVATIRIHEEYDTASIEPDHQDRSATVRAFEEELQYTTSHLRDYDIHVFLYGADLRDWGGEMGPKGAGFNVWQWGTADPHTDDTSFVSTFPRRYRERYAFAFVNTWVNSAYVDYYEGGDPERLFKNTVIHEVGHTFDLNHGVKRVHELDDPRADDIVYDEPGGIVGEIDGITEELQTTPMATWYADDYPNMSNDSADDEFCTTRDYDRSVTNATSQLSVCSRREIREWVAEHGRPKVSGVRPRDVDGDGLYMDMNADGSVTQTDVTEFWSAQHRPEIQDHPELFDYNGNGDVGLDDVIYLFEEA